MWPQSHSCAGRTCPPKPICSPAILVVCSSPWPSSPHLRCLAQSGQISAEVPELLLAVNVPFHQPLLLSAMMGWEGVYGLLEGLGGASVTLEGICGAWRRLGGVYEGFWSSWQGCVAWREFRCV